jgi:LacI family transcriptional regulator
MSRTAQSRANVRVAVCIDKSRRYGRGVLAGIADYVEARGRWSLQLNPRASGVYSDDWLRDWDGDGVLAFVEDPRLAKALLRAKIPAVELFGHRLDLGLPHVGNDEEAFGRLAAAHLLERNFVRFAFVGVEGALWSDRRLAGFRRAVERRSADGLEVLSLSDDDASLAAWERNQERLRVWLRQLKQPIGLMAASDRIALRVLNACRQAGIDVPEQIAAIGVDNDEETCRLADPPLSSVMDNAREIGWRASAMLDGLMTKRAGSKPRSVLVPPTGIAMRRSTEVTAVDDPLVARACQLIRDQACGGLTAEELAAAVRVSKSLFYARFKKALNRLPHEEIIRTRLDQAQALLRQTRLPLAEIATRCGFTHPEYFSVSFKRELGVTPGRFRRSAAAESGSATGNGSIA